MADDEDLRQKIAERKAKHAERMRLRRARESLEKINAKMEMLEQQVTEQQMGLLERQPQRKLSCQQQALAGCPRSSPPCAQRRAGCR